MSTSEAVLEILLTGALALVWIAFAITDNPQQHIDLSRLAVFIPIAAALAYPIGWLLNTMTHLAAKRIYIHPLREGAFGYKIGDEAYRRIKASIYQAASAGSLQRLRRHVAIQRITRGSAVNFAALGIVVLIRSLRADFPTVGVFFVCAVLAAGSCLATYLRQKRYYRDMAALSDILGLRPSSGTPVRP